MKKVSILLLLFALSSCKQSPIEQEQLDGRIIFIADKSIYSILKVDGHEYLSSEQGGIVHLESCQCKKSK